MVNHVVLQGRLVEDPRFGQSNGGTDYANFRVAWSRKYKDKDIRRSSWSSTLARAMRSP